MNSVKIGQIINAVGLKGEVKVYHFQGVKERFEALDCVFLEGHPHKIERVRYIKDLVILKLSGIDDRSTAEAQKGKDIFIAEEDLAELPEDTYYIRDLIGMCIIDVETGPLGILTDVIQNGVQDLYEVELETKKKILIPAVEEFILNIDMAERLIRVKLIEGLMDL